MPITTLDQALAGMQSLRYFAKATSATLVAGRYHDYWAIAGNPGAGAWDSTLNGANCFSNTAGCINFVNPTSGNTYLARFQGSVTQAGVLLLVDKLWHNGGYTITSTSPQNISQPVLPPRDNEGTNLGNGVFAAMTISAATGAGTPTITLNYTNSAGANGRTATNVTATAGTSAIGAFYPIGLQAGDNGIRNVASVTLSATWTSGTMNLGIYRIISSLELPGALIPNAIDALTSGFPRIYDNSCLQLLFLPNTTTASLAFGHIGYTQG